MRTWLREGKAGKAFEPKIEVHVYVYVLRDFLENCFAVSPHLSFFGWQHSRTFSQEVERTICAARKVKRASKT